MKPKLFLDVDGVINLLPKPGERILGDFGHAKVYSSSDKFTYDIHWRQPILRRLIKMQEKGLYEIVWATTWCCDIRRFEQELGLPRMRRAFAAPVKKRIASMAKLSAVSGALADGFPIVWLDDQECAAGGVRDALTFDGRALLIDPDPEHGLLMSDLDKVEEFCQRWT